MSQQARLDGMSIYIEQDREKSAYVDYVFICDVWDRDPRYRERRMITGQRRGLFRIIKDNLASELLLPMELDEQNRCYYRAVAKVLRHYQSDRVFPQKTYFICG